MESCCCGCSLRTGTVIIASFSFVSSLWTVIGGHASTPLGTVAYANTALFMCVSLAVLIGLLQHKHAYCHSFACTHPQRAFVHQHDDFSSRLLCPFTLWCWCTSDAQSPESKARRTKPAIRLEEGKGLRADLASTQESSQESV